MIGFTLLGLLFLMANGRSRPSSQKGLIGAACTTDHIYPPITDGKPSSPGVVVQSKCSLPCTSFEEFSPEVLHAAFYWAYCPQHAVQSTAPADFEPSTVYFDEPQLGLSTNFAKRQSLLDYTEDGAQPRKRSRKPRKLGIVEKMRNRKNVPNYNMSSKTNSLSTMTLEELWKLTNRPPGLSKFATEIPISTKLFEVSVIASPASPSTGSTFVAGKKTKVTYDAIISRNECGLPASLFGKGHPILTPCTFVVELVDNVPPSFTFCPKDRDFTLPPGQRSFRYQYDRPTAADNSGKLVRVVMIRGYRTGEQLAIGNHRFEYTATDDAGNIAKCRWNVKIRANKA